MYSFSEADYQYRKKFIEVALNKMQSNIDKLKQNENISSEKIKKNETFIYILIEYIKSTEMLLAEKDNTIKMLANENNAGSYKNEETNTEKSVMGDVPNKHWHKEDVRAFSIMKLQMDMPNLF